MSAKEPLSHSISCLPTQTPDHPSSPPPRSSILVVADGY